jgi:hypothetical protein
VGIVINTHFIPTTRCIRFAIRRLMGGMMPRAAMFQRDKSPFS